MRDRAGGDQITKDNRFLVAFAYVEERVVPHDRMNMEISAADSRADFGARLIGGSQPVSGPEESDTFAPMPKGLPGSGVGKTLDITAAESLFTTQEGSPLGRL